MALGDLISAVQALVAEHIGSRNSGVLNHALYFGTLRVITLKESPGMEK